ncbi:hypothetical protein CERZMDRAFT_86456 [Cercospora zeae-maydis SCOH1-5]|uniref:DUF7918 domain-containing protein n=1 Tax=Cercospora zeae-maydis SCOH1-5 TaxID=717836 RepID=A0A6A6F9S9_9PEZI|nr:hypothetical protein CERZMDRAFT_86456 [Cercospora zeae-maydis SCOH1-5]
MAINDALPGIEIVITVDGEPLEEYIESASKQEPNTITRYVEAKSDQIFAIRITVAKGTPMKGDCLVFAIYVDGKLSDGSYVGSEEVLSQSTTVIVAGRCLSSTTLQRFIFSSLELATDDKMFYDEIALPEDLGAIEITVSEHDLLEECDHFEEEDASSGVGIVSEKALKGCAISHSVAFEAPTAMAEQMCTKTEPVDGNAQPVAKMVFKYRSRESLRAEMIIPRTPSPPPLEEKEELSQEEVRELQRQMRDLRAFKQV